MFDFLKITSDEFDEVLSTFGEIDRNSQQVVPYFSI